MVQETWGYNCSGCLLGGDIQLQEMAGAMAISQVSNVRTRTALCRSLCCPHRQPISIPSHRVDPPAALSASLSARRRPRIAVLSHTKGPLLPSAVPYRFVYRIVRSLYQAMSIIAMADPSGVVDCINAYANQPPPD